ncbi:hypothetical protein AB0K11_06830 [Mycobacterium sp. NPDC050551]|uniref:hypothetical protein n=1 Tax=Mycobacterium sp. NPDC050551 TaxID=3155407 RepID=UPI00343D920A
MTTIAPPTPAPAGPPPAMTPGGRNALRGALIAVAALLVIGSVVAFGITAWGVSTVRVVADSQNLPTAMRSLVIDTADVPVAIRITADRATREPRVDLRLVNANGGGEHRLAVTGSGAERRVTIDGSPSPMLPWARGGEITVTLPPDQARRLTVRTQQRTGVVLAQADVDQLIARTDDGAVVLSGAARRIEVHTVDGEVTAHDPISVREQFSAVTSDGDIAVDFRDTAPRIVDAVSRNGDVVIGLPGRGPYLVRAQSGEPATVSVPETDDPTAAVGDITARSDTGDVVIEGVHFRRR